MWTLIWSVTIVQYYNTYTLKSTYIHINSETDNMILLRGALNAVITVYKPGDTLLCHLHLNVITSEGFEDDNNHVTSTEKLSDNQMLWYEMSVLNSLIWSKILGLSVLLHWLISIIFTFVVKNRHLTHQSRAWVRSFYYSCSFPSFHSCQSALTSLSITLIKRCNINTSHYRKWTSAYWLHAWKYLLY